MKSTVNKAAELLPIRIASELREDILRRRDGEYLGSEEELVAKYGVSAPTFRQTARLLEQEQLLRVRRGQGGGYYACAPVVTIAARTAATFLRSRAVAPERVFEVARDAARTIARSAAAAEAAEPRSRLSALRETISRIDASTAAPGEMWRIEAELRACLAALANDPISELVLAMLFHVAGEHARDHLPTNDPAFTAKYLQLSLLVADAVLAQEPDLAAEAFGRLIDLARHLVSGFLDSRQA